MNNAVFREKTFVGSLGSCEPSENPSPLFFWPICGPGQDTKMRPPSPLLPQQERENNGEDSEGSAAPSDVQ